MAGIDRLPQQPVRVRRSVGSVGLAFVPYTGATKDVDLGTYDLTTTGDVTATHLRGADLYLTDDDNLIYVDDVIFACMKGADTNLGVGPLAGAAITSGTYNVCIGGKAGESLTGGDYNVCLGEQTGRAITNADYNTILGKGAGATLTTAGHNTFVGARAGQSYAAKSHSTLIGSYCGSAGSGFNSVIAIGYLCEPTADAQCLIGSDNAAGQITQMYLGNGVVKTGPANFTMQVTGGDGTNNPAADFYVAGGKSTGNADPGDIFFQTTTAGASGSSVQTLSTRMTIDGEGTVTVPGLGSFGNLDVDTLNLNDNVISDSTGTISFDNENLITTGNITIDSDSSKLLLGDGQDVSLYFDGSDLEINLTETGTNNLHIGDGGVTNYAAISDTGDISFNGTARMAWSKITANGVSIRDSHGTSADSVSDLQTAHDTNFYTLSEESGETPGMDIEVDFTGVTAFNWIQILGRYEQATAGHGITIMLEITPFNGTAWHRYGFMHDQGADLTNEEHSFFVPDDSAYINSGVVKVRFVHEMGGTSSAHDLVLDTVALYQ